MKYKDLIKFEPITDVIKLTDSDKTSVAETLVKTFVFSQKIKEDLAAVVLRNLHTSDQSNTKGIQIVGSYGTGKSHLMALVSAIAENATLLEGLSDEDVKKSFDGVAGQYKVLRFEVGTDKPLKDIVFSRIKTFLAGIGIDFNFDDASNLSWGEQIQQMISEFESAFPDKHFLIVIDELLEYLTGRKPDELNRDLTLLRQLGEACNGSRFKLIFGVQELIYRSPSLQFAADMLNKVQDRFDDLVITREDVAYVVKERLLKKDEHQKQEIREHLNQFAHLFEGINTRISDYVDLFPVHPSYIGYFERIKHGKSQREILKILSSKFLEISETEVPANSPGLVTFDSYWKELSGDPSMTAFPDIRVVKDKMEIVDSKIDTFFVAGRASKKDLAKKIANGLAISILCDDLDKRNGASTNSLKEDICETIPLIDDADLLLDVVESTANQLVTATAGQYVDQDPTSSEYYIRTEGGVNVTQLIKDYADEVISNSPERADEYFYDFLQYVLEYQQNTYRTGFKIWQDELEWIDKKSFRLGYVFFGNPNERSTTEPVQQYYIFFCPLFSSVERNDQDDEVYFDLAGLSKEFKETICLFGAAKAKEASASSNQKQLFRNQIEEYRNKAISIFNKEFGDTTSVLYRGKSKALKAFPLLGEGSSKQMIFSNVAARLLNDHFNQRFPNYPSFSDLLQRNAKDNFDGRIRNALKKIVNPSQANRDGEAILTGLGLWNGTAVDTNSSKYADKILEKLKEKGEGRVLNRDEILKPHYVQQNLWYSVDFEIDHQLIFVVLAAFSFKGDIEIVLSNNKTISATNIEKLEVLQPGDYFDFRSIRTPQGIPVKDLKALFSVLGLPDLTSELEKPDTITQIQTEARTRAEKVAMTRTNVAGGIRCRNISLLNDEQSQKIKDELETLAKILDGIQNYNTYGKLKNFKYSKDELNKAFEAYKHCGTTARLKSRADLFEKLISYLNGAKSYVPESDPLHDEVNSEIEKLPEVLATDDVKEIKQYEKSLNDLIERYANYYVSRYTKYRLNTTDAAKKDGLLNSERKRIADLVKDSEFTNPVPYQKWIENITSLREADPSLTKAKVKVEPYHDFNPRDYQDKPVFSVQQLEDELDEILKSWEESMRSVLKDPSIQENIEMLDEKDGKLVADFSSGNTKLTKENAARLRDLIAQLAQGIDKVEIRLEDLRQKLNRPLTPNEAIESLTKYVEDMIAGKERSKVRILIK